MYISIYLSFNLSIYQSIYIPIFSPPFPFLFYSRLCCVVIRICWLVVCERNICRLRGCRIIPMISSDLHTYTQTHTQTHTHAHTNLCSHSHNARTLYPLQQSFFVCIVRQVITPATGYLFYLLS